MDSDNLHRRLKKIIGQVQAIDRMIDEDIPCEDILAQINDLITIVVQQHLDDVFTDIMDISLDCGQDDFFPLSLRRIRVGAFPHGRTHRFKGRFGGIGAHQQLRKKQLSAFKILTHLIQGRNHFLVDNGKGRRVCQLLSGSLRCAVH